MGRRKSEIPNKIQCEICGNKDLAVLHKHHIVPRTDPECTESWSNVCIICSNCHNLVHSGEIEVVGIYPSTQLPYKRTLIYKRGGKCNVEGIEGPYFEPKPGKMKIY